MRTYERFAQAGGWLTTLALLGVSVLALAAPQGRVSSHVRENRRTRPFSGAAYAAFEAFPLSGLGTFGPCSTTPPTDVRGEALSMAARGTTKTCSKQGPATTGILPGDLVTLTSTQPAVEYWGSLLTYHRESAATETVIQTETINNAAWIDSMTVVVAPALNGANTIVAPDNTTTAEDYTFPAVSGGSYSFRAQANACPLGVAVTGSFFAAPISGGTTLDLNIQTGAASWAAGACTIGAVGYTRCFFSATTGAANSTLYIGIGQVGVSVTRASARVAIWGANCTAGALNSYVPATTVAVTRNADAALTATLTVGIGPSFSLGASWAAASSLTPAATALQLGTIATDLATVGRSTDTAAAFLINATSTTPAVASAGTTLHRASLNDASGTRTAWWDGAAIAAPAASMVGATTVVSIGALDAWTGRVCADPVPARCDL
jgi:hypothetical protein